MAKEPVKSSLNVVGMFPDAKLPRSPDVDERDVEAAEKQLGTTDPLGRQQKNSVEPQVERRARRKKEKPEAINVQIRGPAPVIDAFNAYKDAEGFKSHWAALEQLLINSGVKVPEFDT